MSGGEREDVGSYYRCRQPRVHSKCDGVPNYPYIGYESLISASRHGTPSDASPAPVHRLTYLPGLDGLRAVAVLAVLLFHVDPAVLPGGFVGVDIFFVLSGYLITRIIGHQLRSGSFSLLRFYQRRIARIAPPLFVVCVAVLAFAACVFPDQDFAETGSSVAATSLSVLNRKLIFKDSYFRLCPDRLPLLHC